jgi:hypothetical protein
MEFVKREGYFVFFFHCFVINETAKISELKSIVLYSSLCVKLAKIVISTYNCKCSIKRETIKYVQRDSLL